MDMQCLDNLQACRSSDESRLTPSLGAISSSQKPMGYTKGNVTPDPPRSAILV